MATIIGPTLPDPYFSTVESIWDELVAEFGIDRYPNPFPHFTLYALGDEVDIATVEAAVAEASEEYSPLSVHTDGIGIFPGNHVWLPVAKSPQITALHADVVRAVEDLGTAPVPFYEPQRWFPHVGFALGLDDERTRDVVGFLLDYDFEWDFTVDDITITRPPAAGEEHEVVASVDL
ncbi:2'-5' RNA ligase family protein [Haladaptatus sp. R4]|uniref:2'-5' RNA ligase family protein n=1 Tax=Haladaptatus sp. R4 TaxID=1679489 RepID=UPI000A792E2A|nr:2'-5' RNA ligase family protein [Haladaptatus sp. R4]